MTTGAGCVVKTLVERGVTLTFGMPGAMLLALTDALVDSEIENILVTSELSAVFMADGYARATGQVGVCIVICGPGLTNMVTGLAEASLDSSPLVVVVATYNDDGRSFHTHEVDQLKVVAPVVKATRRIEEGSAIAGTIHEAFDLATAGEPGPVVVEIPKQLLKGKCDPAPWTRAGKKEIQPAEQACIEQIGQMLKGAEKPGIFAGKGAMGASEQVQMLAERLGAPVASTISGKGVIREDHPLSVGFGFGPAGTKVAQALFEKCDLVLALGVKFTEMGTGGWSLGQPQTLVHIDRSESVFDRNYRADVSLCLDVKAALEPLLEHLGDEVRRGNEPVADAIRSYNEKRDRQLRSLSSKAGVHPSRFFPALGETLGTEGILVTDCGNHQLWAISDHRATGPGTFLTPADYQAMGFGIPAAIGACLGNPDKKVVCVCGDGGLAITGFELLTAVRLNLNLTVAVFNDEALGLIEGMQKRFYGRAASVHLKNPDFEKLCGAFGADYMEVAEERQLDTAMARVGKNRGVMLMNVRIDYSEWPTYMKGITWDAWKRQPLGQKLNLIANRALRMAKYGK